MRSHSHHGARQLDPYSLTIQHRLYENGAKSPERQRGREPSEIEMCRDCVRLPRAHEKTFACFASRDLVNCVISILGLVSVLATNYLGGAAGVSKPGFFFYLALNL